MSISNQCQQSITASQFMLHVCLLGLQNLQYLGEFFGEAAQAFVELIVMLYLFCQRTVLIKAKLIFPSR